MQRLMRHLKRFHDDQSGAVLLLMLAAFLILMMIGWVLYDSGDVSREKLKLQAAADAAAVSQASVKARSMNMLAYTNVAKRSIFAIHAVYLSHFMAYLDWAALVKTIGQFACTYVKTEKGPEACNKLLAIGKKFVQIWRVEARTEFPGFAGFDVINELGLEGTDSEQSYVLTNKLSDLIGGIDLDVIVAALFAGKWRDLIEEVKDGLDDLFTYVDFDERGGLKYGSMTANNWGGFTTNYYAQDLRALDNYQRYIAGATPWWAWTEQLVKGLRNGATASVSFPRPLGGLPSGSDVAHSLSSLAGMNVSMSGTILADTLPVRPGDGPVFDEEDGRKQGRLTMGAEIRHQIAEAKSAMIGNLADMFGEAVKNGGSHSELSFASGRGPFFIEYLTNLLIASMPIVHRFGRTTYPTIPDNDNAFVDFIASVGFAAMVADRTHDRFMGESKSDPGGRTVGGLEVVQEIFDRQLRDYTASPWVLQRYRTQGAWLTNSSNLIFAYSNRADLFEEGRDKYNAPKKDYKRSFVFDAIYRTSGYWTFAKSEINYKGEGKPSLWDASWTSRLRPVTLPDEYQQAGYSLNDAYHDILPTLALVASLNISRFDPVQVLHDLTHMERATRAMGHTTAEGLAK